MVDIILSFLSNVISYSLVNVNVFDVSILAEKDISAFISEIMSNDVFSGFTHQFFKTVPATKALAPEVPLTFTALPLISVVPCEPLAKQSTFSPPLEYLAIVSPFFAPTDSTLSNAAGYIIRFSSSNPPSLPAAATITIPQLDARLIMFSNSLDL